MTDTDTLRKLAEAATPKVTDEELQFLVEAIEHAKSKWTEYEHGGYFAYDKFATIEKLPALVTALRAKVKAQAGELNVQSAAWALLLEMGLLSQYPNSEASAIKLEASARRAAQEAGNE